MSIDSDTGYERSIDLTADISERYVNPTHAAVSALWVHVRQMYIACYRDFTGQVEYGDDGVPRWDGGEDTWGVRHKSIWPKLTKRIIELGVEPLTYIRAQFHSAPRGNPPEPGYLLSRAAWARYQRFFKASSTAAVERYNHFSAQLAGYALTLSTVQGMDHRRAIRNGLLNVVDIQAPALFRYCFATQEGYADVAAMYHDRALHQYVFQRELYDRAWGERIPEPFRLEGEEVQKRLLERV